MLSNIERGKTLMKRIITMLTAILLVAALLFSLASCGSSDKTEEEPEVFSTEEAVYTESRQPVGNTGEEVLNYFNAIVNRIKENRPAISYRYEKNVPDDSIKITKTGEETAEEIDSSLDSMNKASKGVKDMILSDIKKSEGNIAMGDDNSEYLFVKGESWTSKLTVDDVDYAEIKEVGDYYYITIALNDVAADGDTASLRKIFDLRDKDAILSSDEFKKAESYLKFNDYDVEYTGCKITATVNRFTEEITNLNYYKSANITAYMTGAGTYEEYGDISVMFKLEDKSNFDISWESELPTSPLDTTVEFGG